MRDLQQPSSSDHSPDPLDTLLRRGMADQLDRHVGKAAKAFLNDPRSADAPRIRTVHAFRLWWAAPLLAAAAVALVAAPMFRHGSESRSPTVPLTGQTAPGIDLPGAEALSSDSVRLALHEPKDVGAEVQWADLDEGMVWLDDQTPARKIRRQRLETLHWTDPHDSARIEVTIPREEIVLVSSPRL